MILTKQEIKILNALDKNFQTIKDIAKKTGESEDSIRRIVETLKMNNLVEMKKEKYEKPKLTSLGLKYLKEKFPEELILMFPEKITFEELQKKIGREAGVVFGVWKKKGLAKIKEKTIYIVKKPKAEEFEKAHRILEKVKNKEKINKEELNFLKKINEKLFELEEKYKTYVKISQKGEKIKKTKIVEEISEIDHEILKEKKWKNVSFRKYNVVADVEPLYGGKYQPYKKFLDLIKKKMIELGFEEIPTSTITTEFYNFDVLFQPQNHPARTWTDTYTLKKPSKGSLPNKKVVEKIKEVHETGGKTGSKGWRYKWNAEIAMKLMPAAQGTAFSAKKMVEGVKVPARYFAIARVYRPDVLDATHLNEFNQLEGFVVAENISFKHLLGLLAKFAKEVAGAEEIMFYPDYYPFTEPSVQLSAKHPELGWVEFGGAGIFRPEITETLGIKQRVIAWGLGIDRLAMFKLSIKDIRYLFSKDLHWLRKKPIVEKI